MTSNAILFALCAVAVLALLLLFVIGDAVLTRLKAEREERAKDSEREAELMKRYQRTRHDVERAAGMQP